MLIPTDASVYAETQQEWKELMLFLRDHDCRLGDCRGDPLVATFSETINAIRIHGDRFWRGSAKHYLGCNPSTYHADPQWWVISAHEFIERHQEFVNTEDESIDLTAVWEVL